MSLNARLPKVQVPAVKALQFDLRTDALERWRPEVRAAEADAGATVSIYGEIGDDYGSGDGGWTAKRLAGALRAIGPKAVEVNVNSPGGDLFEGVAMYNLLREHPARVTVNVLGLAASAASIVAMAGDEVLMGDGSLLMIHNAWVVAIGNAADLRGVADTLEPFDAAMAEIYAARSGQSVDAIRSLMGAETYLAAVDAIGGGFADGRLPSSRLVAEEPAPAARALARVDLALAKAGTPRSERRELLRALFDGKPSAAVDPTKPGAGHHGVTPSADPTAAALQRLLATLKS